MMECRQVERLSPALPTPRILLFDGSGAGSQTSAWMLESDEGVSVKATWQNGRPLDTFRVTSPRPPPPPAGTENGSVTSFADVTRAASSFKLARLAQDVAPATSAREPDVNAPK